MIPSQAGASIVGKAGKKHRKGTPFWTMLGFCLPVHPEAAEC